MDTYERFSGDDADVEESRCQGVILAFGVNIRLPTHDGGRSESSLVE